MPTGKRKEYKDKYDGHDSSVSNPSRASLDSQIKNHRKLAKSSAGVASWLHNSQATSAAKVANSRKTRELDSYREGAGVIRRDNTVTRGKL